MNTPWNGRWWSGLISLVLLLSISPVAAQTPPKRIVLGADLSPEQRTMLLTRFGADEQSANIQTITTDEVIAFEQASMVVDPGTRATFGTALSCGTPGSGLHLTTDNITDVPAAMYAGALLTAGIGDGEVIVAAPPDSGSTALVTLAGIFKTLQSNVCNKQPITPAQQELTYRWLSTTQALGQVLNDQQAALNFVLTAQHQLLDGGKGDPAAVEPAFNGATGATGIAIPEQQRPVVLDLLRRIAEAHLDWGSYAAGWNLDQLGPNEVRLTPAGAQAGFPEPTTLNGTVRSAAAPGMPLTIEVAGQTRRLELIANNVTVERNGEPAQLTDLQPGDTVTLQAGPGLAIQQIKASGTGGIGTNQTTRFIVGAVAFQQGRQISLRTTAAQRQISIPQDAYIARAGHKDLLASIKGEDSIVAVVDGDGIVQALFAQPEPNSYTIAGTADGAALSEQVLQLRVGEKRVIVPLTAAGLILTRNGKAAQLSGLRSGDQIVVQFDANGNPTIVQASDAGALTGIVGWWSWLPRWWIPLLIIIVLLAPLPLLLNRRKERQRLIIRDDEALFLPAQEQQNADEAEHLTP